MDIFNSNSNNSFNSKPKQQEPSIPLILRERKKVLKTYIQQYGKGYQKNTNKKIPQKQAPIIKKNQLSGDTSRNIEMTKDKNYLNTKYRTSESTAHHSPYELHFHKQMQGQQIRHHLDENLQHIYKFLNQRNLSLNRANNKIYNNDKLRGPKLEQKLIHQYIRLIYNDYSLPDPLPDLQSVFSQQGYIKKDIKFEDLDKKIKTQFLDQTMKGSVKGGMRNMNKKAIKLKEMFQTELFSSFEMPKKRISIINSLKVNLDKQENSSLLSNQNSFNQSNHYIKQVYRYCFVCECPVLEANIQIHQKQKCPEFFYLYEMSLDQLRKSLIKKILRIKKQAQQLYELIFDEEKSFRYSKFQQLKMETKVYLNSIKKQINAKRLLQQGQSLSFCYEMKEKYEQVMKCFQQNYFSLYENIKKLQWFILMLKELEQKYYVQQFKNIRNKENPDLFSTLSTQYPIRRFSLNSR